MIRIILWVFLFYTPSVFGAVTENLSMANAKAAGMAYSVTADPPGVDSVFYNPAGLARVRRREAQINLLYIDPDYAVDIGSHSQALDDCVDGVTCPGNLSDDIFYDEAENSESSTHAIVAVLPQGGLTDLPIGLLPFGGIAVPISSNITFGTSVFSTTTAGYQRDDDDPGRFFAKQLALTRFVYFSPTVGVKLNDNLSVGFGISLSYFGIGLDMPMRLPHAATAIVGEFQDQLGCFDDSGETGLPISLCGGLLGPYSELINLSLEVDETMSVTYQLGVLWDITPWFSWGMSYQSGITDHLRGEAQIEYSDNWQGFFSDLTSAGASNLVTSLIPSGTHSRETSDVIVDMTLPAYFSTGISLQLTPSVKINLDAKMSTWGDTETLDVTFENPDLELMTLIGTLDQLLALETATSDSISVPLYFEDTWSWSMGIEYAYSDRLTLRTGYEDRRTSIPNDRQTVLVPLSDIDVYAVGFSYVIDGISEVDVAFSYYVPKPEHVEAGASANSNSGEVKDIIYNPYAETDFTTRTSVVKMVMSYSYVF